MNNKTRTIEVLTEALNTLSSPEKWTKCAMARDQHHDTISAINSGAVCWCLDGALYKAAWELGYSPTIEANITRDDAKTVKEIFKDIEDAFYPQLKTRSRYSHINFNDHKHTKYENIIELIKNTLKQLNE